MSEKQEVKHSLSEQVLDLGKKLKKEIKISDTGVAEVPKDIYDRHLPEGITMDTVKKLQAHDSLFAGAFGLALGESAEAFLSKKKGVNDVNGAAKLGKDVLEMVYTRERQVRAGPGAVAEGGGGIPMKTQHGILSSSYTKHAAGHNRGQLGEVRKYLSARAAAAAAA